jgi:nucleotide-binding universal stress UspA family protein
MSGSDATLRATSRRDEARDTTRGEAPHRGPVLACIDDGTGGDAAARVAGLLARMLRSRLFLTTVLPAGAPRLRGAGHSPRLVRRGRTLLAWAARDLAQPVEQRVMFGEPAGRLIALAQREQAAFAVTCAAAPSSTLLGSAYIALAGAGPCPLVIVPRDYEGFPADGPIVCGIDGSLSSRAATRVAADLAILLDTELHCVRAGDRVCVAQRLTDIARRERAPLMVVGSRGLRNDASVLLGSVSAQLARMTARPLVIVPSPARPAAQSAQSLPTIAGGSS